jgi:hypothetical protein
LSPVELRHRFEPVVLGATLALIPVFVIEAEAKSSRWKDIAYAANWADMACLRG